MIHWARWFSGLGLVILCALLWELVHFRIQALAKLDSLRNAGTPIISISADQMNRFYDCVEGIRTHMSSNHDEVDGKLRQLNANNHWLVDVFKRYLNMERDPIEGPNKVRK